MTANWLQEEYTIDTPENVTFGYEIAGIGSRFLGGLLDSLVLGLTLFLLNIILIALLQWVDAEALVASLFGLGEEISWAGGLILALYTLLNFVLIWGYYVVFELIWNGQTPGKRWSKLRVVRVNGNPAGFLDIVLRNLVRIVDFLPTGYAVGLTVMFLNQQARRLGDYAAGTIVIKERSAFSLDSLGATQRALALAPAPLETQAVWQQRFPALRRLSATDYELIRDALARHDQGHITPPTLHRLAQAVAGKVEAITPDANWQASRTFLVDVAEAYQQMGA